MSFISKITPNLYDKLPGGKRVKKALDIASGGVLSASRIAHKAAKSTFPAMKSLEFPFEMPKVRQGLVTQGTAAEGIERRRLRRGRPRNILTRPGALGVATTRQAGLKTTFG